MHLRECKLRIQHYMIMDPFGITHRAIGSGNYVVPMKLVGTKFMIFMYNNKKKKKEEEEERIKCGINL